MKACEKEQPRDSVSELGLEQGTPALPAGKLRRPAGTVIVLVPVLVVLITFLFWYQTWFGRQLSDREMDHYLTDTSVPHKTQHALSQLAGRMARRDAAARRWYPLVLRLAGDKEPQLRSMSAWVMGQDNRSEEFHQALRKLVQDREPVVRWNAALALVRFHDAAGEPQLRLMLRPYALLAPQAGTVKLRVKAQDAVAANGVVARIEAPNGTPAVEVRSPLTGQVERLAKAEGAQVAAGEQIAVISPGEQQVWESLRALFLVGQPDDLEDVERFARLVPGMTEGVRQQASLTARAIRQRAAWRDKNLGH
jgi:biotin carboxyl carrier protein